jgi:hypothetical protein
MHLSCNGGIHDRLAHITGRVGKLADHCMSDWWTDTIQIQYSIIHERTAACCAVRWLFNCMLVTCMMPAACAHSWILTNAGSASMARGRPAGGSSLLGCVHFAKSSWKVTVAFFVFIWQNVTPIFKDKNRMHKRLMCAPGNSRTHKLTNYKVSSQCLLHNE